MEKEKLVKLEIIRLKEVVQKLTDLSHTIQYYLDMLERDVSDND